MSNLSGFSLIITLMIAISGCNDCLGQEFILESGRLDASIAVRRAIGDKGKNHESFSSWTIGVRIIDTSDCNKLYTKLNELYNKPQWYMHFSFCYWNNVIINANEQPVNMIFEYGDNNDDFLIAQFVFTRKKKKLLKRNIIKNTLFVDFVKSILKETFPASTIVIYD